MKIIQLIDSLHSGGAERMCVNISNLLHENGHEVTLCATRSGGPLEKSVASGVNLQILRKKSSIDLIAFRRLLSIIKDNGIEVIHAHSSSLFWAVAAKVLSGKVKVIWHDHLGLRVNDRKKTPVYRLLSGTVDAIISVNQELAEWSRNNMNVPAERIVMINNFPLLKDIARNPDSEFFTVVCLANLRPQKDHETLVRAVALLIKRELPKRLKVIFAGSMDDGDYSQRIKSLIADLSLENTIEMPGTIADTATLLGRADCGVLSSSSEGLPVALLEYGMAALPVVVTDVGQCSEVLDYGKYGFLTEPGDSQMLSDKLYCLITNDDFRNFGVMLNKRISQNYSPTRFMEQYDSFLRLFSAKPSPKMDRKSTLSE